MLEFEVPLPQNQRHTFIQHRYLLWGSSWCSFCDTIYRYDEDLDVRCVHRLADTQSYTRLQSCSPIQTRSCKWIPTKFRGASSSPLVCKVDESIRGVGYSRYSCVWSELKAILQPGSFDLTKQLDQMHGSICSPKWVQPYRYTLHVHQRGTESTNSRLYGFELYCGRQSWYITTSGTRPVH